MKYIYLLTFVLLAFTKGYSQSESDEIFHPVSDLLAEPPAKPEKFDIRIFPNPTFGNLKIETMEDILVKVLFWDIHGRPIHEAFYEAPLRELNLSLNHLPKGIYFLQLHLNDGNRVREKIVTQ